MRFMRYKYVYNAATQVRGIRDETCRGSTDPANNFSKMDDSLNPRQSWGFLH